MKNWFSNKDGLLASTIIAGATVLGAATPAVAQDTSAEEEAIVVTGSRIARPNLTSPTAVTTVDAEAIELSGEDNIAEILRGVPSFGVSGITSGNSNFFTSGVGINTLQLRNLGEDRTLVLVNGRRYVSGVPGSSAVDFNTIPTDLLERVEVVTGGASAVYGADALAGVINLILRDDFEGVEYRYQYGESEHGDDVNQRFSFLAGGNFGDGRGNAVVNAVYTRNDGVFARDRENTELDDLALCFFTGVPNDCKTDFEPFFSSFSEYGRFFDYSTGESRTVSSGTGFTGTVVPWNGTVYGFNRQAFRRYTVPLERFQLSSLVNYDINPNLNVFAETMYTHSKAESELEPFPHSNSDLSIAGIPCDNPFAPPQIVADLCDDGDTVIPYFRRLTEIGNRGAVANRNTYRVLLGARGDLADTFDWEVAYSFGRTEDAQRGGGQINVANMREALNAIDLDGDPLTTDDIVCANPVAIAEGCVPINLFGLGSISPEAAAYVSAPTQRQGANQQENLSATLAGPAFQAPGGSAEFVLGAEWRREYSEDVPDALTQTGQNASNLQAPTFGGYHVGELFGEIDVPLITDAPFVEELSVGAAYRWSDYNLTGTTEAYTGRVMWAPTDFIRFRAQYARAVRVPNIGELFAPAGENFAPVADPCDGVTAVDDPSTTIDDNCRADPFIAARIADQGVFDLTQPELQGTGGFTGGGNTNLSPETADSYTFGFVFDNDFGAAGTVTLSVDWYKIELEQIIRTLGRQETLNLCYNVPVSEFPNVFCDNIVRDMDGPAFQLGELLEVNTTFFNDSDPQEFSGIDLSLAWNFTWSDFVPVVPGDMSVRLNATQLLYETEDGPGNTVGSLGSPEYKAQLGLVYTLGGWNVSWETNYTDDVVPSLTSGSLFNFNVGDYVVHDLRVGWDVSDSANVYFGSNNVFDEDAPPIITGVPGNTTGTDTSAAIYDPIGRTFYAGVRLRY